MQRLQTFYICHVFALLTFFNFYFNFVGDRYK